MTASVKIEGTVPIMRIARSRCLNMRSKCAQGAGVARNENATDAQLRRDHPGNARPHAAKWNQCELARAHR